MHCGQEPRYRWRLFELSSAMFYDLLCDQFLWMFHVHMEKHVYSWVIGEYVPYVSRRSNLFKFSASLLIFCLLREVWHSVPLWQCTRQPFFVILSIFTLGILKWCYEGHTSLKLLKLLVNCTFYPFIFNNTFFFPWKSNINVIMLAFFWLIFTWYIFLCYFAFLLSGAFSKKEVVWYRGKKYRL